MRTTTWLRLGYLAAAVTDTALAGSSRRRARRARWVTKPALMPTLAASLATDERARRSPLRTSTLVGLGGGWVGDVALLGSGERAFVAGASAFGLGHLGYIGGYVRTRRRPARWTPISTAALVIAGTLGPAMGYAARRHSPALAAPVAGYTALLTTTLAATGQLGRRVSGRGRIYASAGAGLFVLSDGLIGLRQFVWPGAPATVDRAVMATYAAAQYLLAEAAREAH